VSTITFENVGRRFDSVAVLDKVNLHVRDKEFVAIVGPSGCGKTTCLRMAAGLDFPSSGAVRIGAKEVVAPGPDRAVVFQQFALFPWKSRNAWRSRTPTMVFVLHTRLVRWW
jgi:NitT/TauT family transport system ATP-binding protein